MLKLEKKEFAKYVAQLEQRGVTFILEKKRSVSNIIMNGTYFALSKNKNHSAKKDKKKKEVISLFSTVAKNINKHILKKDFNIQTIEQRYNSTYTNREKYAKMKTGATFYYIDVAHCFWRIAFLKEYISTHLYQSVLKKKELKMYRNMALACIVAPKSRDYYIGGSHILNVSEDKSMYRTIYDNIRFTSYNLMGEASEITERFCIGYRTDGIMVTRPAIKKVKDHLKDNGFDYKIVKCCKIDDKHFYYGNRVVKM